MNTPEVEKKTMLKIVLFVSVGALFMYGLYFSLPLEAAIFFFALGAVLNVAGVALAFSVLVKTETGFSRAKKLLKDKKGVIWVWAVFLAALFILDVAWWALSMPMFMLMDSVEGMYDYSPEALAAMELNRNVVGWFLILMTFGLLIWAFVNSQRREDVTYPM